MNPILGVLFHWVGGLCAASFYVPYKKVNRWSWEIVWLTGGVFSWVVAPWVFASLRTKHLVWVLSAAPTSTLLWCWFWGVIWGFGGLTFGLVMRYLGLSLGMAVVLGITTVIGTLGPPVYHGTLLGLAASPSGKFTLLGILVTLVGIGVVAKAGWAKDQEIRNTLTKTSVLIEFNLKRGLSTALFSGLMSGCFAWGLAAGQPIRDLTLAAGTDSLSQGLPVLCVILAGGFATNFAWCAVLIKRNRSAGEWVGRGNYDEGLIEHAQPYLLRNYFLAALGGCLWYLQFFFYTMGESQMGRYGFSSWTLHMASIILFSTLWGFALREWAPASSVTRTLVRFGIALLISSTAIIGIGNSLAH